MKPFAVFFLAVSRNGKYAGTTRVDNKVGLPGGKVDPNENPIDAAVREAYEEGWVIKPITDIPIYQQIVNDKLVFWYVGNVQKCLENYKEKKRGIRNIYLTKDQIKKSGFGNENLFL